MSVKNAKCSKFPSLQKAILYLSLCSATIGCNTRACEFKHTAAFLSADAGGTYINIKICVSCSFLPGGIATPRLRSLRTRARCGAIVVTSSDGRHRLQDQARHRKCSVRFIPLVAACSKQIWNNFLDFFTRFLMYLAAALAHTHSLVFSLFQGERLPIISLSSLLPSVLYSSMIPTSNLI